jgi:hypothetical protein
MVAEDLEAGADQPRRRLVRVGEAVLRRFDQPSVRHARGARGLAAAALHARVHELDELRIDRCALPGHGAHRGDAPTRRQAFLARHPIRRAVRQAEAAADAACQFRIVEL